MEVLLVSPKYPDREALFWNLSYILEALGRQRGRQVKAPTYSMALPTVAALIQRARPQARIRIVDESVEELDVSSVGADLVCISAHTLQVDRAFQIADGLKRAHPERKILLGGAHIGSARDDEIIAEALEHVDSVVIGEADNVLETVLDDLERGRLQPSYFGNENISRLEELLLPRFDLLRLDSYLFRNMEASRGCNRRCSFCNVTTKLRFKNPEHVVEEIKYLRRTERQQATEHRSIFFTDSLLNPLGHEDAIKGLMEVLIRYREQRYLGDDLAWFGQVNTQIVMQEFDELLDMMSRAGAKRLLIGFEGFYFDKHGKHGDKLTIEDKKQEFLRVIRKVRSKGIDVFGSFVVGFDDEPQGALAELEEFINDSGLVLAQVALRTPFPGTRDFRRFRREGRLLHRRKQGYDWQQYTGARFVFAPSGSLEEKQQAYYDLLRRIYSDEAIGKRIRIRQQSLPYGPLEEMSEQLYVKSFQQLALRLCEGSAAPQLVS